MLKIAKVQVEIHRLLEQGLLYDVYRLHRQLKDVSSENKADGTAVRGKSRAPGCLQAKRRLDFQLLRVYSWFCGCPTTSPRCSGPRELITAAA